jgi:hypothetical protein
MVYAENVTQKKKKNTNKPLNIYRGQCQNTEEVCDIEISEFTSATEILSGGKIMLYFATLRKTRIRHCSVL